MHNMPDSMVGHENLWIPFMRDSLHCDERTLIIGHSTGAVAAMRYAETHRIAGIVLVSTYATDLGDETERESGYFGRPWKWDDIRTNAGEFVVQFGSTDDPLVPWEAQKEVAESLRTDLRQFEDRGHFMSHSLKEIVDVVQERLARWPPFSAWRQLPTTY